jgi:hypothetical protein
LGGLFRDLETPTGESSLEESLCEIMQQHPQPDELAVAIKTALKNGRKVKEISGLAHQSARAVACSGAAAALLPIFSSICIPLLNPLTISPDSIGM